MDWIHFKESELDDNEDQIENCENSNKSTNDYDNRGNCNNNDDDNNYSQQSYKKSLCTGKHNLELLGFFKDEIDINEAWLKIENNFGDDKIVDDNKSNSNDDNGDDSYSVQLYKNSRCTERENQKLVGSVQIEANVEVLCIKTENDSDNKKIDNNKSNCNNDQQSYKNNLCTGRDIQELLSSVKNESNVEVIWIKTENHYDNDDGEENTDENNQHANISVRSVNETITSDNKNTNNMGITKDGSTSIKESPSIFDTGFNGDKNISHSNKSIDGDYNIMLCNDKDIGSNKLKKPYSKNWCIICNKKFPDKWILKDHLLGHVDEKPYQCHICDRKFIAKYILKQHLTEHFVEKFHPCDICKKTFLSKSTLTNHLKKHTIDMFYQCNYCDKKFIKKTLFNQHLLTHPGEKPYHCDICEKKFTHESMLANHLNIHIDERPYRCEICDRKFAYKFSLTNHLKRHMNERPYQCNMCDKTFARNAPLAKHLKRHMEEMPHQCHICNKKFVEKYDLIQHLRTHKPYQCEICKRKFDKESTLAEHSKRHTDKKPHQDNYCLFYNSI